MVWKERSLVVLGATAGLAKDTLEWLAGAGAGLVLQGRDGSTLQPLAESLRGLGASVETVVGDVQEPDLGGRLWEALERQPGEPFGFLCFVGIPGRMAPEDWTPAALADIFAVNCAGPLLLCRDWCNRMKAQGLAGNAVLFSTMQANYPFEGSMAYSLGKVALQHGIQLLGKEMGASPVLRINGLAPGVNDAGMAQASIKKGKYQPYLETQCIPRYGNPGDIQQAVEFLLTPGLYMTGQTLLLDGGLCLRRDQM